MNFLGIDKALQIIEDELVNNTLKLTEMNECIKKDSKKLKEVEDYCTYSERQKQLYRDRLIDLNTEKTRKASNTTTRQERSSDASRKDKTNH